MGFVKESSKWGGQLLVKLGFALSVMSICISYESYRLSQRTTEIAQITNEREQQSFSRNVQAIEEEDRLSHFVTSESIESLKASFKDRKSIKITILNAGKSNSLIRLGIVPRGFCVHLNEASHKLDEVASKTVGGREVLLLPGQNHEFSFVAFPIKEPWRYTDFGAELGSTQMFGISINGKEVERFGFVQDKETKDFKYVDNALFGWSQ